MTHKPSVTEADLLKSLRLGDRRIFWQADQCVLSHSLIVLELSDVLNAEQWGWLRKDLGEPDPPFCLTISGQAALELYLDS